MKNNFHFKNQTHHILLGIVLKHVQYMWSASDLSKGIASAVNKILDKCSTQNVLCRTFILIQPHCKNNRFGTRDLLVCHSEAKS